MKQIDLSSQYQRLQADIDARFQAIFAHGQFVFGPEVRELESKLAQYVGVKHCITVANGTDALLLALMALGIKAGDEVITLAFSFFATAEVVALLGAKPVFVDICPESYNLDPQLLSQAITAKTKAIIPVDLYGQCANYTAINAIAKQHNLAVVEDAAQSFGGHYNNQTSCGLGDIGCTSFFPTKPLGAYGDGGACFTNNDALAEAISQIRNHGQAKRYYHTRIGLNSRLASFQAAVVLSKLTVFDEELELRQQCAQYYNELLGDHMKTPQIAPECKSAWAQYTVAVENRDVIQEKLNQQGIPTAIHYPKGLHQQPVFMNANTPSLPVTETAANQVLSLPFHPYLTTQEQQKVANALLNLVNPA
jgi:UDP-2-acetamido-2-deoxy-ribo-hexuluronate aminotransferase